MDFQAFIEFDDLGLEDYIINLDWDIVGKTFPFSRHTSGDVQILKNKTSSKKNTKVFKKYNFEKLEKSSNGTIEYKLPQEIKSINKNNKNINKNNKNINEFNKIYETNEFIEEVKENVFENIVEELINNTDFSEHIENKTEEHVNNITNILNLKVQESNSLTIEQINDLENNLKLINNNYVHHHELKKIEEKVSEENEKIKKDVEQQLNSQKDYFMKFLNS